MENLLCLKVTEIEINKYLFTHCLGGIARCPFSLVFPKHCSLFFYLLSTWRHCFLKCFSRSFSLSLPQKSRYDDGVPPPVSASQMRDMTTLDGVPRSTLNHDSSKVRPSRLHFKGLMRMQTLDFRKVSLTAGALCTTMNLRPRSPRPPP